MKDILTTMAFATLFIFFVFVLTSDYYFAIASFGMTIVSLILIIAVDRQEKSQTKKIEELLEVIGNIGCEWKNHKNENFNNFMSTISKKTQDDILNIIKDKQYFNKKIR